MMMRIGMMMMAIGKLWLSDDNGYWELKCCKVVCVCEEMIESD